jgi:DNA polymerase III subunit delta'
VSLSYPWLVPAYEHLYQQYANNNLHHAVLLSGQASIGKSLLARALAERLLCSGEDLYACGKCKSCLLLASDTHPDLTVLTTEEKSRFIKVDQVRVTIEKLANSAQQGGNKVVIVNRADQLNVSSANAMLKSLEEPTKNTFFVMLSNGTDRLLPTVVSRCYVKRVATPSVLQASEWLQGYARAQDDVTTALHIARGSPLKALSLLQTDSGLSMRAIFQALESCTVGDVSMSQTAKILAKADLSEEVIPVLHAALRQTISQRLDAILPGPRTVNSLAQVFRDKAWTINKYFELLDHCDNARRLIASSSNPNHTLLLEDLLIRLAER